MSVKKEKEIKSNSIEGQKSLPHLVNSKEGHKDDSSGIKPEKDGSKKPEKENVGDVHKNVITPTNDMNSKEQGDKVEKLFEFGNPSPFCDYINTELEEKKDIGLNQAITTARDFQDNESPKKISNGAITLPSGEMLHKKRKINESKKYVTKKLKKPPKKKKPPIHLEKTLFVGDLLDDMIDTPIKSMIYPIFVVQEDIFSHLLTPIHINKPKCDEGEELSLELLSMIANIHSNHERVNDRLINPYPSGHILHGNYSTASTRETINNN